MAVDTNCANLSLSSTANTYIKYMKVVHSQYVKLYVALNSDSTNFDPKNYIALEASSQFLPVVLFVSKQQLLWHQNASSG